MIADDPGIEIGEYAFYGFRSVEEVSIQSCGNIGKGAFRDCKSLNGIEIQSCGDIGKDAFIDCASLETAKIGKCGDIGQGIFAQSTNMITGGTVKSIEIGSCGKINGSAFSNLNSLESVKIGECVSIGGSAFASTTALKTVELGSCQSIDKYAFMRAGAPIETLTLNGCVLGELSFPNSKIKELIIRNSAEIGDNAFSGAGIEKITLSNIIHLGEGAFSGCKGLTELTLENLDRIEESTFEVWESAEIGNNVTAINLKDVKYIGDYAFKGFSNLETVHVDGDCQYVGAHAFSGCNKINAIDILDTTKLGYSDSFVNIETIKNRVVGILADKFDLQLPTGKQLKDLTPDGWTSSQQGKKNSTNGKNPTQLTKEAKWNNEERTVADVQIKANFAAEHQMDFVFVADCSNSMSGFGSSDAMNSNFYNMQSKMMDVADELLSSTELDTQVAFTTFGESEHSISRFYKQGEAAEVKEYIWKDIVNYYSNTNYAHGLAEALTLVEQNRETGRKTTVIFISDGQPYYDGTVENIPPEYYGTAEAKAIREAGADIIAVLQQVPEDELASSMVNMKKLTDTIYASTDLEGFSKAVNSAVDYAYHNYVLTDTVHPDFILNRENLKVQKMVDGVWTDAPEVSVTAQNNVITRSLGQGNPFVTYRLTFQQTLKRKTSTRAVLTPMLRRQFWQWQEQESTLLPPLYWLVREAAVVERISWIMTTLL